MNRLDYQDMNRLDYQDMRRSELLKLCEERGLKGYKSLNMEGIIKCLEAFDQNKQHPINNLTNHINIDSAQDVESIQEMIIHGDVLTIFPTLEDDSAQIIIADPPYNIGKDFGNRSDKQPMNEYLDWSEKWIKECLRILKPNGTMFIYGFSEILALILSRVPFEINRRWLIWHYTNKNVPSLHFWQRSHESILVLWKNEKVFHRDDIREPYTDGFLNGAAGKERASTKGRFSKGEKTTTYTAHPGGALPRDVIKIPALSGGAGAKERVNHPTQKPLALCEKLIKSCMQSPSEGYVFVPFAGSGSECVAAKKMGLSFIGVELNEEYVKIIHERLAAEI